MRSNNLKIRNAISIFVLCLLSVAAFSSRANAQLTDSIGKIIPGVYQLKTGSPYSSVVQIEIFNNGTFRLELYKMGAFTRLDIHHLFEGRIVREPTEDLERLGFKLVSDRVWRVNDSWTGLFSPYITDTTLMQEPPEFARDLAFNLHIEKATGLLGATNESVLLEILDSTKMGNFSIFATVTDLPAGQPRRISNATFSRFDTASRSAIGSAAQASYACQSLF